MLKLLKKYEKTVAFLLGALAVASMPPYYIFPALMVAFCGLFCLLENTDSYKKSFLIGYLFGFGFFSFGFLWIGNAVLIEPEKTGWLYPIIFLASGAYFGLFSALPAMLVSRAKNVFVKIFSFAAYWTFFEWIRGWFLTGFPWNPMGSALAFHPIFIQSASIFDVYGLSFLTVLFCLLPYAFFKGKKSAIVSFLLMDTIFCSLFAFGYSRLLDDTQYTNTLVRLVQPAIPQELKWDRDSVKNNFLQYVEMSAEKGIDSVDFVIWGETASPFNPRIYDEYLDEYKKAIPENGYLVFGAVDFEYAFGDRFVKNSMLVMNKDGELIDSYDKIHLVPFGEYIPLREYLPDVIQPVVNIIGEFKKGKEHNVIKLNNQPAFSGLICYEVIFPAEIVDAGNRPDWIAVLTNDGWYGISAGPYQHLVSAELRAVEEGLPIVRSANSGISAVIDSFGRITAKIDLAEKGILDAKIPQAISPTIYAKYGNYIILLICAVVCLLCAVINRKFK